MAILLEQIILQQLIKEGVLWYKTGAAAIKHPIFGVYHAIKAITNR